MTNFHTRLAQARRRQGMTQLQLAQKMQISRQTISHWENGRMQPNEDSLAMLYDLFPELKLENQAVPKTAPHSSHTLLKAAVVLAAVAALALLFLWPTPQPETTVQATSSDELLALYRPADQPLEWYFTPQPNEPDKAYLNIVLQEEQTLLTGENIPEWHSTWFITEENGIPFTLRKQTISYFDIDGQMITQITYVGDELLFPYPSLTVTSQDAFMSSDAMGVNGSHWFCLYLEGTDANGNTLAFGRAVELLDELEPPEALSDYQAKHPSLDVSFSPSPCVSIQDDYYDRGEGFEWLSIFTNTGEIALTITNVDTAWFNHEKYLFSEHYNPEFYCLYYDLQDAVLAPGESMTLDEGMPIQYDDFTHIAYRVTAVDENGNEITACGMNEFVLREGVKR